MYSLIKYSDNCLKTFGSLWQDNREKLFISNNGVIIDVPDASDSASFKSKKKITGQKGNDGEKKIFK